MKATHQFAIMIAIPSVLVAIGTYYLVAAGTMQSDPLSLVLAFLIGISVLAIPFAVSEITLDELQVKVATLENQVQQLNETLGKIGAIAAKFDKPLSAA
jgi:4-amino-4-deoxy-L-arabinose transferase-like glycosyltransferase